MENKVAMKRADKDKQRQVGAVQADPDLESTPVSNFDTAKDITVLST